MLLGRDTENAINYEWIENQLGEMSTWCLYYLNLSWLFSVCPEQLWSSTCFKRLLLEPCLLTIMTMLHSCSKPYNVCSLSSVFYWPKMFLGFNTGLVEFAVLLRRGIARGVIEPRRLETTYLYLSRLQGLKCLEKLAEVFLDTSIPEFEDITPYRNVGNQLPGTTLQNKP
jgi:hypothetical protein